jgi:hypothetical protein
MAIIKANYVRRGRDAASRAKATLRYITHRRDRDGMRLTRTLFGFDGPLTKAHGYQMIDAAPKGTFFYRIVISPDPTREDRFRDLNLQELTLDTMLAVEARLHQQVQFVATLHDDHSPHRHVHTLVLLRGRRLTRGDFRALRAEVTSRARSQRLLRDRTREQYLGTWPSRTLRTLYQASPVPLWRRFRGAPPYQSYTCALCGYHQALPYKVTGYRCPLDGLFLRRGQGRGLYPVQARAVGWRRRF